MNCWPSGKYVHLLYMYSILGRGSFCFNYCSIRRGMEVISLWHCWGGMEAQVSFDSGLQLICIVGSGVSHLPLDNTHRFSMGFRSGEFAGQSSTVTPWSIEPALVPWQCGQVPSPAGKWNRISSKTVETSHWTSSNMESVPLHSSLQTLGPCFQMKC